MPPKRKNLSPEADEKLSKTKVMKKSEPKSKVAEEYSTKLESEYKDTIKYDEYMEGGIPSSLLEGLGLTESESVLDSTITSEDVDGDDNNEDDGGAEPDTPAAGSSSLLDGQGLSPALSSFLVDQMSAVAKTGVISGLLPQQIVDLTTASPIKPAAQTFVKKTVVASNTPMRTSQRLSSRNSPAETTPVGASNPAFGKSMSATSSRPEVSKAIPTFLSATGPRQMVPLTPSLQKVTPRNARFYNSTPRTVTKGNIVYERMPTGEVVASLVRKSHADSSGKVNDGGAAVASFNRGFQPPFQSPQSNPLPLVNLDNCPINEYNVGEVLEKSIKATQSMRMLLTSLRDDLRRIGAGSAMVTEEQIRKRQEVADKLTKAYSTYKHSIEDIESPGSLDSARLSGRAPAAGTRHILKLSENARPVMLVKNDAVVRSNVPSKPTTNAKTIVNAAQAKSPIQEREVIELSESDDESADVQKEFSSDAEIVRSCRPAQSVAIDSAESEVSGSIKSKNSGQNSEKAPSKDKSESGESKRDENSELDAGSSDCNGHQTVKVEK